MKKYERLKENIDTLRIHNERHIPVLQLCDKTEYQLIRDIISDLTELIEKIENGTLIEFPCKVGDTVYFVDDYGTPRIEEYKVYGFGFDKNGVLVCIDFGVFLSANDVCLTKAEAKAKLKQLRGEE